MTHGLDRRAFLSASVGFGLSTLVGGDAWARASRAERQDRSARFGSMLRAYVDSGTLAGVVGSLIIAGYAVAIGLVGASAVVPCLIAAFVATNIESLIGATMQGGWMTNEVVNFINTLIGAAVGIALAAR